MSKQPQDICGAAATNHCRLFQAPLPDSHTMPRLKRSIRQLAPTLEKTLARRASRGRSSRYRNLWAERLEPRQLLASDIRGQVWHDANQNGLLDAAEPGLATTLVELVSTSDSVVGNTDDRIVAATETNGEGHYLFPAVSDGQYYLRFSKQPANGFGHRFTTANVGTNDSLDSDIDPANGRSDIFNHTSASPTVIAAGLIPEPTNLLFALRLGGEKTQWGKSVVADSQGNIYVAVRTDSGDIDLDPGPAVVGVTAFGGTDIAIAKYGTTGQLLWAKSFGSTLADLPEALALDSAGNVYITGYITGNTFFGPGPGQTNLSGVGQRAFAAKLDPAGGVLWARQATISSTGLDISVDAAGSAYVAGTQTGAQSLSAFVWKLDANGVEQWQSPASGTSRTHGIGVTATSIYVTGTFQGTTDFDPSSAVANVTSSGGEDIFLWKLDRASGAFVSIHQIGGASNDVGQSLALSSDGSILITGSFSGTVDFDPTAGTSNLTSSGTSAFVVKWDSANTLIWARNASGASSVGYDIVVDASGAVWSTGLFNGTVDFDPAPTSQHLLRTQGANDFYIWSLNAAGNLGTAYGAGSAAFDLAHGVALTTSGDRVIVAGNLDGTADFDPGAGVLFLSSLETLGPTNSKLDGFLWALSTSAEPPTAQPNQPPSGANRSVSLAEDSASVFTAADFGFTDPLEAFPNLFSAVRIASLPSVGQLTNNGTAVSTGQLISLSSLASGGLRYQPPTNESGTSLASFAFQVQDNGGTANGGSDLDPTANSITFNVLSVNDAPRGTDGVLTVSEDTAHHFAPGDFGFADPTDSPPHSLLAVSIASLPDRGFLTLNDAPVVVGQRISALDLQGAFKFLPPANQSALPLTSFEFQVQDNGGTASGGVDLDPTPRTLTLNVTPRNDAPTGADRTVTLAEDSVLVLAASDFGFADLLDNPPHQLRAIKIGSLPSQGSLANYGLSVSVGQLIAAEDLANGSLRFTPSANATGTSAYFLYQVQDDGGTTNGGVDLDPTPNTLIFDITAVNDLPVAADDAYTTNEDIVLVIPVKGVLLNDADVDTSLLTATIASQPAHGTLTFEEGGSFRYVPALNYNGTDSFTYRADDGFGGSNVATVSLTVTPVNDPPLVMLMSINPQPEGSSFVVAGGFGDPDAGDTWTATIDLGDGRGEQPLAFGPNRRFELSHAYPDNGNFFITIRVRDAAGDIGTSIRSVRVANFPPRSLVLNGPSTSLRGQEVLFAGSFIDPSPADTFTGQIDWGDGQTSPLTFSPSSPGSSFVASHAFVRAGVYEVVVRVQDDDGEFATRSSVITVANPIGTSLNNGVLELAGSPAADNIAVSVSGKRLIVNATYGQAYRNQVFALASVQRIVANLDSGDDALKVDARLRAALFVDAGAGNDKITAGGGPAVLVGGDGDDLLYGGGSRDLLIGGSGRDQLWGYGASDLLIAERTSYDDNAAALHAIMAEWRSSRALAKRISNLRGGTGPVLSGTGVSLLPSVTTLDDGEVDLVMGGGDSDWFILQSGRDQTKDRTKADRAN